MEGSGVSRIGKCAEGEVSAGRECDTGAGTGHWSAEDSAL